MRYELLGTYDGLDDDAPTADDSSGVKNICFGLSGLGFFLVATNIRNLFFYKMALMTTPRPRMTRKVQKIYVLLSGLEFFSGYNEHNQFFSSKFWLPKKS